MHAKFLKSVSALALLLLLAGIPYAQASTNAQSLSLNITGGILSSGDQQYTQSGGALVYADIFGHVVTTASWVDDVVATVSGSSVSGYAFFSLSGTSGGGRISLSGDVSISQQEAGESFPDYPTQCTGSACTSSVPGAFLGEASVVLTTGTTKVLQEQLELESAFANPFGGAIVIASADGSILIVATYTHAVIDWSGVQVGGALTGTLGQTAVRGSFTEVSTATEDLFHGTETESGSITFSNMVTKSGAQVPSLDGTGTYTGSSTIPIGGEIDCSTLPEPPVTCEETGFQSTGQFGITTSLGAVHGQYKLTWTVPSLYFSGVATATVTG